jgi:hypothetical protein
MDPSNMHQFSTKYIPVYPDDNGGFFMTTEDISSELKERDVNHCQFSSGNVPVHPIDEEHYYIEPEDFYKYFTENSQEEIRTPSTGSSFDDNPKEISISKNMERSHSPDTPSVYSSVSARSSAFVPRSENIGLVNVLRSAGKKLIMSEPVIPTNINEMDFDNRIKLMLTFFKSPRSRSSIKEKLSIFINDIFVEESGLNLLDDPTNVETFSFYTRNIVDHIIAMFKGSLDEFKPSTGKPPVRETDSIIEETTSAISIASSAAAEAAKHISIKSSIPIVENPRLTEFVESKRVIISEDETPELAIEPLDNERARVALEMGRKEVTETKSPIVSKIKRPTIRTIEQGMQGVCITETAFRETAFRDSGSSSSSVKMSIKDAKMSPKDAMIDVYTKILSELNNKNDIFQNRCFDIALECYPHVFPSKWLADGKFTTGGRRECGKLLKEEVKREGRINSVKGIILNIPLSKDEFVHIFR